MGRTTQALGRGGIVWLLEAARSGFRSQESLCYRLDAQLATGRFAHGEGVPARPMAGLRCHRYGAEGQRRPMVYLDMMPISVAPSPPMDRRRSTAPVLLVPRATAYGRWFKRPTDIALSVVLGLALAPLMVVVALSIPMMLGKGGIIYRQERIGRDGHVFTIYKFRSMLRDRRVRLDPDYRGPERRRTHKSIDDPRHTRFGRFLRATSIDELPQLLNVLKGEMSMVGPRPELIAVAIREGFADHPRHLTRPGLTGAFQVSPLRSASRISAGLHLDIDYVVHVRFADDLKILARTLLIPFQRRGR